MNKFIKFEKYKSLCYGIVLGVVLFIFCYYSAVYLPPLLLIAFILIPVLIVDFLDSRKSKKSREGIIISITDGSQQNFYTLDSGLNALSKLIEEDSSSYNKKKDLVVKVH